MVKRTILSPTPRRLVQERLGTLARAAKDQTTVPTGIKDLGSHGNIIWGRPDGSSVTIRDIDQDLNEAAIRITEAELDLGEQGRRLEAAEDIVHETKGRLDHVELETIPGALGAIDEARAEIDAALEGLPDAGQVTTSGPPPVKPTIGSSLWASPSGRMFRAVECEEEGA